jgi:flagellar hook-length control protein FliK
LTQLSPQIQTEIFPNELFPGVIMARPGAPAGPGAEEAPQAGRFAALLDLAGAVRDTPPFGAGAAFLPPESAPFSPVREPDRLYDNRPPDAAPHPPRTTDVSPESGAASQKTETSPTDDRAKALAEARREDAGAAYPDGDAEFGEQALSEQALSEQASPGQAPSGQVSSTQVSSTRTPFVEGLAAEEAAGNAENTGSARERAKQGREKPKVPGEDLEMIPGFEGGVLAEGEIDADRGAVISGEPDEADDTAGAGSRPVLSAKPEITEGTEKPDGAIRSGAAFAASLEDADAAPAEKPGADLAGAETAGLTAEGKGPGAEFSGAKAAAGAAVLTAVPEAELATLSRQQKPAPERAGAEKGGREEPGEARKGERRKFNPELRDFRTTPKAGGAAGGENTENNAGRAFGDYAQNHGQEREIIVDLKSQARSQAEVSYNRESRAQLSFRETLARELHENLNGDIVRHASIVLRDGGEGLIRLSLKPEHLGNVKIRLEMSENKVVGRITVESGEALRAFEQELRSLEQAFRDSGFEGASLEMSVSSGGGQGGAGGYREEGEDAPFFSERLAAHSYDTASGAAGDAAATIRFVDGGGRQVNVLA